MGSPHVRKASVSEPHHVMPTARSPATHNLRGRAVIKRGQAATPHSSSSDEANEDEDCRELDDDASAMASGEDEVVTPTDRSYIHDDLDDLDAPRESARKELMDDGPPGLPPFRARSLDAEMANAESASLEATAPSPPLYIHDVVFALRAPAPAPQSGAAPWAVPPAMPLMVKLIASSLALPMEAPAPPPTFTTDESAPPPLPPPLIVDDDDAAWLQCGHKYWLQAPSKKLGSYELYGAVRRCGSFLCRCNQLQQPAVHYPRMREDFKPRQAPDLRPVDGIPRHRRIRCSFQNSASEKITYHKNSKESIGYPSQGRHAEVSIWSRAVRSYYQR